jgi:Ca2+/Na+ antiporter
MKFKNRDKVIFSAFGILIIIFWLAKNTLSIPLLVGFMIVGLIIAILASEKAVEGIDVLGKKLGLTPYVSGVLSSLASNSPELVIGGFAILNGQVEFAIAFIIIATGFNILMLGILVILGNYQRKKPIIIPQEVVEIEVPIVRVAIVIVGSIFVYGIVLFCVEIFEIATHGNPTIPFLPYEANIIMVAVYLFYLFFIIRHNLKNRDPEARKKLAESHTSDNRSFLIFILLLGFGMIFFAGEMISSSVELFLDQSHDVGIVLNEFQLAFFIGAAASIPEHAIALLAVKKEGGIELGLGNLIAGSMQNLLLMTGLVSLFSYIGALFEIEGNSLEGIPLIHIVEGEPPIPIPFLLVQFGFAWLLLFMIKSSMTDDRQLDIYEGFTITIAQVFVFVIFLRGILGF